MKIETLKHTDGREISLDMDVNTVPKLENQLMILRTMVYIDPKDKSKGKRIYEEKTVCINCSGECLFK